MTLGDGLAFMSAMALCGWIAWLRMGWPKPPFNKDNDE